jgi:hypothetical protein
VSKYIAHIRALSRVLRRSLDGIVREFSIVFDTLRPLAHNPIDHVEILHVVYVQNFNEEPVKKLS